MHKYYIAIIIILLLGSFYWFEYRPNKIRKDCFLVAKDYKNSITRTESDLIMEGFTITKRADYEKLFDDKFKECKLEHGIQ